MSWVCEYSFKQEAFHVDELERALRMNRETFLDGTNPGYAILGIFETQQEAEAFAVEMQRRM